ncbi:MAG: HlyC/CorC family transporter [Acidimicrobiia bacterium]|nr:HlyC/CorC family transporter [Acidimicrobiia bacterium]
MDISADLGLVIGLGVAFISSIFLSAAETALLRISPIRALTLEAAHGASGRRLARLVSRLPNVLNAVLLWALLAQITAATLAAVIADRWFGSLAVSLASVGLTVLLFIYGEAIPKTYAVRHPDRVGLVIALPVQWLELSLRPLVSALLWIADLQMPGKGITAAPTVTEDELRRLAIRAAHEGEITPDDVDLIERAFRLGDRRADDIMVPRPDIVSVSSDTPVDEALEVLLDSGHRRLPVFDVSEDDIGAFVKLADLIRVPSDRRPEVTVGSIATQCLVVPASNRVTELLAGMRSSGIHLAIIVDEFGGTDGLVTVEDITEELIGSLTGEEPIVPIGPHAWSFDAMVPIQDLADLIGAEVLEQDVNTVAGLAMKLAGQIPAIGDEVTFGNYVIRVTGLRRRRITRVEIKRVSDRG